MSVKIDSNYLNIINNSNTLQYFGVWVNNINNLNEQFLNAEPFEHIVIDNFLSDEYAEKIHNQFPSEYNEWHKYCNPLEYKYTYDNINSLDSELKNFFYYLSTDIIIELFKKITNIDKLENDAYLHGAGLHAHPRGGHLNVHLDYEKHPISGKNRRLNVIFFVNKDWDSSWNGSNELYNNDLTSCVKKTDIKFNRAIIFKTNDISWHGVHEKITCPEGVYRKSLAYYYVSPFDLNSENNNNEVKKYREKATFQKRYNDPYCEKMDKLYEIRKHRLLTEEDLISFNK